MVELPSRLLGSRRTANGGRSLGRDGIAASLVPSPARVEGCCSPCDAGAVGLPLLVSMKVGVLSRASSPAARIVVGRVGGWERRSCLYRLLGGGPGEMGGRLRGHNSKRAVKRPDEKRCLPQQGSWG